MSTELLEKNTAKQNARPPAPPALPPAAPPAKRPPLPDHDDEDEDEPGFLRRYRVLLILGLIAAGLAYWIFSGPSKPAASGPVKKAVSIVSVSLPPPAPPPPPPPPKVEQPKEEMEEQTPVAEETPPEDAPADPAPAVTSNGPTGNDNFGLRKGNGGSGNGTGNRIGGGGSKFGNYAAQVQNSISAAVRRNSKTKSSNMTVIAKIWADETGRVTRATLSGSSGDPAVDSALKNEVLTGLQLQSPPPAGMKMPINLRLTARAAR